MKCVIITSLIVLLIFLTACKEEVSNLETWEKKVGELQENSCESQGYQCVDGRCAPNQVEVYGFTCYGEKVCCRARIISSS